MYDLSLGHIVLDQNDESSIFSRYGNPFGQPYLCDALAALHKVSPSEVAVTTGASMALASIFSHLPNGSVIACPRPYYPPYLSLINRFGLTPYLYNCNSEIELTDSISELAEVDYKAIIWNFPHNPTGMVPNKKLVSTAIEQSTAKNALFISDEVYSDIFYETRRPFYASEKRNNTMVIVKSFSKTLQLAGERVGYLIGDSEVIRNIMKQHWILSMSAPISGQVRAFNALNSGYETNLMILRERLNEHMNLALSILYEHGVSPIMYPRGGVFIWLKNTMRSSMIEDFSFYELLKKNKIVVSPGKAFGVDQSHIRVSFAIPKPELIEAFTSLGRVFSNS